MPKRKSASSRPAALRVLGLLAALAVLVFAGGELFAFATSDFGRVLLYRHLHVGDRARLVRIVGRRVHEGLAAARVPAARVHEEAEPGPDGGTPRWTIDLPADGAPMQVNLAVTRAVEQGGAVVLSGHEASGPGSALAVTLVVGVPGRPLHELVISRPARIATRRGAPPSTAAHLALVLFGFGDQPALVRTLLARHEPFAVAVPAIGDERAPVRRAARAGGHELVLQIPMEPEKYPSVNPGPGTLLVNMSARHIEHAVRDMLDEAGDVAAASNLMGSFATQDEPFMTAVYHELKHAGLPFLHTQPVPRSVCRTLASRLGIAYDEPVATLDAEARAARPAALERAWKEALASVQRRGRGIVLVRATPTTERWLAGALAPGALGAVTLEPLSTVERVPESQ